MNYQTARRERTRRAILDALAHVIVDTRGLGFSVQQVADRAGVTHRTVYNHFPTRDTMNDALAEHVEHLLALAGHREPPMPASAAGLVPLIGGLYAALQAVDAPVRANVILTLVSRRPSRVSRRRTAAFEAVIARDTSPPAPVTHRGLTAAVRLFLSTTGWHLLTEQLGLSAADASATATWAADTLIAAAARPGRASGRTVRAPRRPRGDR